MESSNLKSGLRIVLALGLIAVGVRTLLIFKERHEAAAQPQPQAAALEADDYVTPKKLHAYDLNSAKQALAALQANR